MWKRIREAGKCSLCGSTSVSYGNTELDGNCIGYEITCDDCGAFGKEWHDIVYTETVMEKED